MDGRTQAPVQRWCLENLSGVQYCDTITLPGIDGILAREKIPSSLLKMAKISVEKHGSKVAVVVGHTDCAGARSCDRDKNLSAEACATIASTELFHEVYALWIDVRCHSISLYKHTQ